MLPLSLRSRSTRPSSRAGRADPRSRRAVRPRRPASRHLAHGGEMRTLHPDEPRESARDLKGTHGRRARRLGQHADESGQDLSLGPVQDRVEMGGQRSPEEPRGDVGVGAASHIGKQAGVVRLRRRRRVDLEPVSEPARRVVLAVGDLADYLVRKRSTSSATRVGWSNHGMWPAPSTTLSAPLGSAPATRFQVSTEPTESAVP